jgi:hypothetical protein
MPIILLQRFVIQNKRAAAGAMRQPFVSGELVTGLWGKSRVPMTNPKTRISAFWFLQK